jgi:chemotaxis protein MotA
MKAATGIGIGVAIGGLLLGVLMEGGNPMSFLNIPAILIVLGGTLGVTIASVGMDSMKLVPALYKKALNADLPDPNARRAQLVGFAEKARRDGLLALDNETSEIEDPFTRKGLQLVVDGTDPDMIEEVLGHEIDGMSARHHHHAGIFEKAGGFSPTMGIIGTVMSLVHVLENLAQPELLGHMIAGAFMATLYGVGMANVVMLPISNRLKALSALEHELRTMTMEGILGIQAGENPRVIDDKLAAFIPPAVRDEVPEDAPAAAAAAADPVPAQAAA